MSADLQADTAVRPDGDVANRYHVALPSHWDFVAPSGGVLMSVALRAAEAHLAEPHLRFASATTVFCTPLLATNLVIDVTELRRGKATSQLRVAIRHRDVAPDPEDATDNGRGLELLTTFVRDRKGPDVMAATMPRVRKLADSLPVEDGTPHNPHTRFAFFQQLEARIAEGEPLWASDQPPGPARYARWFRYRTPQRDALGRFDRLALPPLMDTMPSALTRAIGTGGYRFFAPSLDLTTYVVDDTTCEWLLVATSVRRAHRGWAIGECEVWDEDGRFVAHGTQAMYVAGVAGQPPVLDATQRD